MLLLNDGENSWEEFSGNESLNVSRWIDDFEEMAENCRWTDVHKVTFEKKMLTSSALVFVRQERCAKTWTKLKKALKDKFEDEVTDQQIHQELAQKRKKADETLQRYTYAMRHIAGQGTVDTRLIEYIIQGIPDEVENKKALYSAKTMQALKDCFKQYKAMKKDMMVKPKLVEKKDDKTKKLVAKCHPKRRTAGEKSDKSKCFSCGGEDHVAGCPDKKSGVKCFNCTSRCDAQTRKNNYT